MASRAVWFLGFTMGFSFIFGAGKAFPFLHTSAFSFNVCMELLKLLSSKVLREPFCLPACLSDWIYGRGGLHRN